MQPGAIARLGGTELARALQGGVQRVFAAREHLDRINVFPVPDGDTGTNLALTLGAVLSSLKRATPGHAGELLTQVADAALDGARGNSGAILAQFLLGVGDRAGALAELGAAELAAAVAAGARYAREALSMPREGTMITVLAAVAVELDEAALATPGDVRVPVRRALERGREALAATRGQLAELEQAAVVDAGAAGFIALLEGFSAYLDTGVLEEPTLSAGALTEEREAAGGDSNLAHRWCTECLVSGTAIDRRQLREQLAAVGSSLVVAGTSAKVRVHVHANAPAEVFRIAATFGTVSAEKADDMQRQQEATLHAARRQVAVVTDTGADIPDEELERLDIHVVPARVHFGDQSYLDKVGLTPQEFYRMLATHPVHPTTSQPPAGDFRRMFEFLTSHYASVISVNLTGRVSGTRQAAESAAARVAAHARIDVFDSRNAGGGEGLLVMHAAECALAGLGREAILASLAARRPDIRTFACMPSLDYGVRGGRVPAWARTVANWLNISPYLATTADGRVAIGGFLAGRTGLTAKFARMIVRRMDPKRRYRLLVSHGDAPAEGAALLAGIERAHGGIERAWLIPLGTAIGVHGGPGTLVVGLERLPPAVPPG